MIVFSGSVDDSLDNAFSHAPVPPFGNSTLLPLSADHLPCGLGKFVGILTYENIGAHLHRLNVLGVAVQRDARHLVERCFLSHITAVGDNAEGMLGEIGEAADSPTG